MVAFVVSLAAAGGATAAADGTLVRAEFADTVGVVEGPDHPHVWESESNTLKTTFETTEESDYYEVCVHPEGSDADPTCTSERVGPVKTVSVNVSFENLSAVKERNLTVELHQRVEGKLVLADSTRVDPVVIAKDGDLDNDQLTNRAELDNGTSMYRSDTDRDSLSDGSEVKNYETSPLRSDTDDDGLTDAQELEMDTDPLSSDTDDDGLDDSLETRIGTDPTRANNRQMLVASVLVVVGVIAGSGFVVLSNIRGVIGRALAGVVAASARLRSTSSAGDDTEGPTETTTADGQPPDSETASPDRETVPADRPKPVISDEEVIIRLLRDNDGWLYQSEIVEARDWSKSKVSRMLSSMEESDRIQKITVGRQNVIAESGSVPEGLESPFGD
ncbi:helix-turn-helix transcriptional regulator [Salinirubrum litoreum]|uniref:MarR family transcriptional regulator n=1 Tax=Salinirubrum litoreum TaxID=1126234 RepID=A0ABD5RCL8_9EURY|nr:hypothetical protein [Salinirubrum litoreum]